MKERVVKRCIWKEERIQVRDGVREGGRKRRGEGIKKDEEVMERGR